MSNGYYESALLRLRRIATYLNFMYEAVLEEDSITPVQFEVMLYIDSSSPCSITEVADFMVVDKSTSSRLIKSIQEKGWVTIEDDREDRRRKKLNLTPQGKEIISKLHSNWVLVESDIRNKYDEAIEYLEEQL